MGEGGHPRGPDRPGPALEEYLGPEEWLDDEPEYTVPTWAIVLAVAVWTLAAAIWIFVAVLAGWI